MRKIETNKADVVLKEDAATNSGAVIEKFWSSIPENEKEKFFEKAFEYLSGEGARAVWGAIKADLDGDRALTEEDKDALVRKLKIDRSLLDTVDTVFTAMELILKVTPTAIGIIWDVFQLGPLDEAVAAIPVIGPVLAVVTAIFSFLPEGTLVGILASISTKLQLGTIKWLKNILIHKIIPEPKDVNAFEQELKEALKQKSLIESFEVGPNNLAAEFRLYETLWD